MKGYVGVTDLDWFRFLSAQESIEEVNFWQPSGGRAFRALPSGAPFFFKLKSPHNAIAGFGLFAQHSVLPDWLAWEAFGAANGAQDYETMRRRIERYLSPERRGRRREYRIGCLMVAEPVFFSREEWIPQPRDWSRNIVQGKGYDLAVGEGRLLWDACLERASTLRPALVHENRSPRFGAAQVVHPRLGQGIFRIAVTVAYDRTCAVTAEHSLPVLEAAHIRPYADGGEHRVQNGLLLRTDVHRLFDKGYVTITPDHRFEVSRALRQAWHNGRTYYDLHGRDVRLPQSSEERPDRRLLAWHNETVFRG